MAFALGIAAEPGTWATLRRPADDPLTTICVLSEVVLPIAMLRAVRRVAVESVESPEDVQPAS